MPGLRDAYDVAGSTAGGGVRYRTREQPVSCGMRNGQLVTTIESEVIPQLMRAHGGDGRMARKRDLASAVDTATRLAMRGAEGAVDTFLVDLAARGFDEEDVLLDVLAVSARDIGALWVDDRCSFADVTVAVGRLQRAMHGLVARRESEPEVREPVRTILLAPAPGEQHVFGAAMAAEIFRCDGWFVIDENPLCEQGLLAVVADQPVDVVGLSLSGEVLMDRLASAIRAVRDASLNRNVSVLVGGQLFSEQPDMAARIEADGVARDGRDGLWQARRLCGVAAPGT